jgi:acyl carrier protein
MSKSNRYPLIEGEVKAVLKNLSGRDLKAADTSASFFDLGFDSLLLTQASQSLRQKFGVKISFRQLLEELVTIDAVSTYLDEKVPADKLIAPVAAPAPQPKPAAAPKPQPVAAATPVSVPAIPVGAALDPNTGSTVDRVVKQQLALMARQLELLRGGYALRRRNSTVKLPLGMARMSRAASRPPRLSRKRKAPRRLLL